MAVQIASRGTSRGLPLAPAQVFHHHTVATLAAALETEPAGDDLPAGPVPLRPCQAWLLAHEPARARRWARVWLLSARSALDPARLAGALDALMRQHDVFRIGFTHDERTWCQDVLADPPPGPLSVVPLAGSPLDAIQSVLEKAIEDGSDHLSLDKPPLCRMVLLQGAGRGPDRLLILLHPLIADDVSLGILLNELEVLYHQDGDAPVKLPRTSSFAGWAASQPGDPAAAEVTPAGEQERGFVRRTRTWGPDVARRLPAVCRQAYVEPDELLVAALLLALGDRTGASSWTVQVPERERGRGTAPDLSWSVGAFVQSRCLRVDRAMLDEPLELLRWVKDARRTAPHADLAATTDGVLFHCSRLAPISPEATFQVDSTVVDLPQVTAALGHPLEAWLTATEDSVRGTWFFDTACFSGQAVDAILESFGKRVAQLLDDCANSGGPLYSPGDFPDVELDQGGLDHLLAEFGVS